MQGWVVRHSNKRRTSYGGSKVIDMDRLKKDYKFNDVSDRSFFYLDKEFFKATPTQTYKDKEESP